MPVTSPTTAFMNALRFGNILMQARMTVYSKGVPIGGPYDSSLSIGSVTVARNSAQRRTGQITLEVIPQVPPVPLMPIGPTSLLAPFGNEIYLEIGVNTSSPGTDWVEPTQWVPLGLFTITESNADDTVLDCIITLNLADRSYSIGQRSFLQPYNIPATSGGLFVNELPALLNMVWEQSTGVAALSYNITPTDAVVSQASYNQGSNPWQAALDMANSVGYELFFDAYGTVVARPIPNPYTQTPVWHFTDDANTIVPSDLGGASERLYGDPFSTPAEVQVQMTQENIFNEIVIQGTGSFNSPVYTSSVNNTTYGAPILATAADTNPASPTYINGGLGTRPQFVASSLVSSGAAAQAMANNDLTVALSSAWNVTLQIPPNPILDVDDVISITRPRVGLKNALVVIDSITHNIRYADLTSITGRVLSNQL